MLKYVYNKCQKFNKKSSYVVCNFSFNQVGNGQWVALYGQGIDELNMNLWSRKDTIA